MHRFGSALAACFLAGGFALSGSAHASAFRDLHDFLDGADGATPAAPVIADAAGNLFGVAHQGGANNDGVVFEVAAGGTETVLYSFKGGNYGYKPLAGLLEDVAGNLYGTTIYGGGACDCGIVFKLSPDGTETVLHAFAGGQDGANPQAALIADASGNLYGTTTQGGASGKGIVFKLAPDGKLTVLHAFTSGADGGNPQASLILDKKGNLYGTAVAGGTNEFGTVFRLTPRGALKVLHAFAGGKDGENPLAGVIADKVGNLYGTTRLGGGNGTGCFGDGCGTVFRLAPDGTNTVLYAFSGGSDGSEPYGGVVADRKGDLYGTTISGGSKDQYGTAFKLAPDGAFKVLHTFTGPTDGEYPEAGLIIGTTGNLFGTAYVGGTDAWGTVFELAK